MLKIGWFSSGNGIGSLQLLSKVNQEIKDNNLNASIEFVFTNIGVAPVIETKSGNI